MLSLGRLPQPRLPAARERERGRCAQTQIICGMVVTGGHPRGPSRFQRRQKPALYCRGSPVSFCFAKREGAGLENDRAQLGEAAAAAIIEIYQPKRPMRQCP